MNQLTVVRGGRAGAERAATVKKNTRTLKAGLELLSQLAFDTSNNMLVKKLRG
jgi:hypothetical protein